MKMDTEMVKPFFLRETGLRLFLFGGKGGVGKTTCAAAAAVQLAVVHPRSSFLLISTDPAHSLADSMRDSPFPRNMKMLELDAQACLASFKAEHAEKLKEIASRGTFLDDHDIGRFLDLSLPGLDELMAFLEISKWVEEWTYDCIVVDTAPTGHTLRMLALPELIKKWLAALDALLAKHRYMKELFARRYDKDELDLFLLELSGSVNRMQSLLADPKRCRFVPVMVAEPLSTHESIMLLNELEKMHVPISDIVINRVYRKAACPVCMGQHYRQMREIENLPERFAAYSLWGIPMYSYEVIGLEALEAFWGGLYQINHKHSEARTPQPAMPSPQSPIPNHQSSILNVEGPAYFPSPELRLLLFAGKGGVGKTTLACATALRVTWELGDRNVLLFSTDPAHSLSTCLDIPVGPEPVRLIQGLTAMEIDSEAEFQGLKEQYAEEIEKFLNAVSPNLDFPFDRDVMERLIDLSPPGLDEIMALTRAMELLAQKRYDLIILDSAPTGHLIRLLETPDIMDKWIKTFFDLFLKYKNMFRLPKISQRMIEISKHIKYLKSVLRQPNRSALHAVAILTEMAFEETKDLINACNRMEISVPSLFLNLATPENTCPFCKAIRRRETQVREKLSQTFPDINQTLIYRWGEPRGLKRLWALGAALYQSKGAIRIEEGLGD
jgi:arsenite/tail-anchored protein-transporting ATPase